jgi:hypothetical protein
VRVQDDPEVTLRELVVRLHSTSEPDPQLILDIGCGDLESLLFEHEIELWPTIERLAREDVRFRRALSHVWAYDSPAFEQRETLLEELGAFWPVSVSVIVYPEDFTDPPLLGHRAVQVDGEVPGGQLPRILREVADKYERDWSGLPEINSDRVLFSLWLRWSNARWALERACWELGVSRHLGPREECARRIDALRATESDECAAFREEILRDTEDR